jgi:ankyrin repeat protein
VKQLFREIRAGDLEAVATRLRERPALVRAIASAPPKKDDGQSTLQVAVKSGQFAVAHLLLDAGADVDFVDASALNHWHTPVLHDAVRAAVFSSRFGRTSTFGPPRIEVHNTREDFDRAYAVLERMVGLGADPRAVDSADNPALWRAAIDADQVMEEGLELPDRDADLRRVFDLLLGAGADPDHVHARLGKTLREMFSGEPVLRFLDA